MVIAIRNGRKRVFDDVLWKEMPSNKYGWVLAADEPEEVKQLKANAQLSKKEQSPPPSLPDSIESLQATIAKYDEELAKPKNHHTVVKSLLKRKGEVTEKLNALLEQKPNPDADDKQ